MHKKTQDLQKKLLHRISRSLPEKINLVTRTRHKEAMTSQSQNRLRLLPSRRKLLPGRKGRATAVRRRWGRPDWGTWGTGRPRGPKSASPWPLTTRTGRRPTGAGWWKTALTNRWIRNDSFVAGYSPRGV